MRLFDNERKKTQRMCARTNDQRDYYLFELRNTTNDHNNVLCQCMLCVGFFDVNEKR